MFIRLNSENDGGNPKVIGRLFFISTLGGVFGVYFFGLYFIPNVGIRESLWAVIGGFLLIVILLLINLLGNGKNKLLLIAFIEGLSVIILEILGKNILCPHFGNSLTVWTIIIGNTFLFLSIGYYISTYVFRKMKDKARGISNILLLAAFLVLLTPLISSLSIPLFLDQSIYFGAIISHILIFAPLFILFGIINPYIIHLYDESNQNPGNSAAKVFFVSTVGGIIGCIILTINLSSNIEIRYLFLAIGFLLILTSSKVQAPSFKSYGLSVLLFFNFLFFDQFYESRTGELNLIYHSNSLMGDLKVYDFWDKAANNSRRNISVNNIPQSSIFNNAYVYSTWNYVHRISMFASLKKGGDALLVGMGGGTIASELQKLNFDLTIVDIDQRMFKVAQNFYYHRKKKEKYIIDDARYYLNTTHNKQYDLLVFDVLNGESQPNNIFTREGFEQIKKSLKPNGIILIEFQELNDSSAIAYKSICNTMLSAGLNTYLSIMGDGVTDFILIGSRQPIDLSLLNRKNFTYNTGYVDWMDRFMLQPATKIKTAYPEAIVLTDNRPVLDKYCEKTRLIWRKNYIESLY